MSIDCPDVEKCRDPIYKAIGERVKTRNVISIVGLAFILLGGFFSYWNITMSGAQEKVEARVQEIEKENKDTREKQANIIPRLEAVEKAVTETTKKVDENQKLLIKIGAKLGIEQDKPPEE